jgi:enoyl-CoA hydratase/carnithine racemase
MSFEHIRYEVAERILTITLQRPDKLNAFTRLMEEELILAFDRSDADDGVRAVIVTGAGRAFCAGADLARGGETWGAGSSFATAAASESTEAERYEGDGGGRVTRRIFDSHKPVIAAINGPAVGIGLTMTLAMDMRMAVRDAKLGFVFAARGIVPEACSSWFLPRIVGISQALEWCYSAQVFRAEEGLRAGLLRSVHDAHELLPAARALASGFATQSSAVSIALTRHMMWRMLGAPHPIDAHEIDTAGITACGKSNDAREGIAAFLEKRPAHFQDRLSKDMPAFFPWWTDRKFRSL